MHQRFPVGINSRYGRMAYLSLACIICAAIASFTLPLRQFHTVVAQTIDRTKLLEEIIALQNQIKNTTDLATLTTLREQLKNKEALFLSPAPEDFAAFADFLKQSNTGLIRIMPRENFDGVLSIRGGGAYYSFVRQEHPYGWGSDLSLGRNNLNVGFAGANFGFLVSLGNKGIAEVALDIPGVGSLSTFTPPLDEPGARQQQQRARNGFQENGFFYIDRLPATLGTTYALRSVGYEDSDVLVAFRLFRQDTDGSLIIPWKLLKRYATPQLNGETVAMTSAASYAQSNFARETIAAAFGKELAAGNFFAAGLPLPTRLGDAYITVQDSSDRPFQITAPLFAVTPTQINFLIPPETAEGFALVTVNTASGKRLRELVRVAKTAPGIFTANSDGQGVPAAVALRIVNGTQSYEPVARFESAQNKFVAAPLDLGSETDQVYLLLFATGIRNRSSLDKVSAKIGGVDAPINYAGAQGLAGLDQINIAIPRSLIGRGEVDLALVVDDQAANFIRINIK